MDLIQYWFALGSAADQEVALSTLATLLIVVPLFIRITTARLPLIQLMGAYLVCRLALGAVPLLHNHNLPSIAELIQAVAIFGIGLIGIRLWTMVLFRQWLPALRQSPPRILEDIVLTIGFFAWGGITLHEHGVDLSHIVTTSAILTGVVAFAMQDTLGNILSGLALQWDTSVKIGDWLEIHNNMGLVVDMNWRATYLQTRSGDTIVIPNSVLTKGQFTLIGQRTGHAIGWRRDVFFDVSLETLPTQIIAMVESELDLAQLEYVAAQPAPRCLLKSTEHGVGRFMVRYWLTEIAEDEPADSLVRTAVDAAIRRNGRRLAPPQYNVLMSLDGKKYNDARSKRHTNERATMLGQLDLLAALTRDERDTLAERLRFTPYVKGDAVVSQGSMGNWLYIVTLGQVEQFYTLPDGSRRSVGEVGCGNFFGELALMTGEPYPFTVIAKTNVECYRLDRESFQNLIEQRPELAAAFSSVLAQRMAQRQALMSEIRHDNAAPALKAGEVLAKMRQFFGLAKVP